MGSIHIFDERTRTKAMRRRANLDHRNVVDNRLYAEAAKLSGQEFTIRVWLIRMFAQALQVTVCVSTRRK